MTAALFFANESKAQFQVGLAYGSDTEIGFQGGYYMPLAVGDVEGLSVGGDLIFYLPDTQDVGGFGGSGEVKTTWFEVNINGHYNALEVGEDGMAYGLAGIQYARVSIDSDFDTPFGGGSFGASGSDIGLNIGAGVGISRFYGEAKFGLGGFEQLVISGGVRF